MPTKEFVYAKGSAMICGNFPDLLAPFGDRNVPHAIMPSVDGAGFPATRRGWRRPRCAASMDICDCRGDRPDASLPRAGFPPSVDGDGGTPASRERPALRNPAVPRPRRRAPPPPS